MPGSSDDSDAECDDPQVVVNRYKQAQHRAALSSPQLHQRACQELAELHSIITQCTSARVRKAILAEVMSDTRLAVELCDGYDHKELSFCCRNIYLKHTSALACMSSQADDFLCRVARNTLACRTLVADAVQCLPHAKGREISRLLKAKSVKAARHHHKMTTSNQDAAPVIQQIPTEVLGLVLDQLDPFALAAAACTSRQWQQEAYKEHRWQVFCRTLMGDAGRAADSSISRRKTFYLTATGRHHAVISLDYKLLTCSTAHSAAS